MLFSLFLQRTPNATIDERLLGVRWSPMETPFQVDEQKGYHRLYAGAMLGIRNPTTHEFGWVDEPELALELIVFARHLLRKAKAAEAGAGKVKVAKK